MEIEVQKYLASQGVTPEQYLAWLEQKYRNFYIATGVVFTSGLVVLFIAIGYDLYRQDSAQGTANPGLLIAFIAALIVFIALPIFWVTVLRPLRQKKIATDDDIQIQMNLSYQEYYTRIAYLKKINSATWQRIREG